MVRHLPVYIIDHVAATTKTDLKSLWIQCRRGPHPVIYNRRNYLGSEPEDYKGSVKVGRLHCNRFDIRSLPVSVRDGLLGGLMTGFDIRGCNATILKGCFPHLDLPYLEMYLRDRARVCPPDVPLSVFKTAVLASLTSPHREVLGLGGVEDETEARRCARILNASPFLAGIRAQREHFVVGRDQNGVRAVCCHD